MKVTTMETSTERLDSHILELRQRTWEKADAAIRRERVKATLWVIPVLALVAIWAWMITH